MLKIILVGLTAGLVNFKTLIWKGISKNAPETPADDVNEDTRKATSGGINGRTSTPETGKCITIPPHNNS